MNKFLLTLFAAAPDTLAYAALWLSIATLKTAGLTPNQVGHAILGAVTLLGNGTLPATMEPQTQYGAHTLAGVVVPALAALKVDAANGGFSLGNVAALYTRAAQILLADFPDAPAA